MSIANLIFSEHVQPSTRAPLPEGEGATLAASCVGVSSVPIAANNCRKRVKPIQRGQPDLPRPPGEGRGEGTLYLIQLYIYGLVSPEGRGSHVGCVMCWCFLCSDRRKQLPKEVKANPARPTGSPSPSGREFPQDTQDIRALNP